MVAYVVKVDAPGTETFTYQFASNGRVADPLL
jgi:hypothetical protein